MIAPRSAIQPRPAGHSAAAMAAAGHSIAAVGAVVAVAALAASGAAGCLAPKRTEPLSEAVRTYNDGVRWGRYEMAASRLPPARRDDFLDQRDQLADDLRINGYEVIRVRYDKERNRARVQVKYTWYRDSRGIVHETHAVQSWERRGRSWILIKEQHLRGEPMPGVDEDDREAPADGDADPLDTADPGADPGADAAETGDGAPRGDARGTGDSAPNPDAAAPPPSAP